MAIKLLTPIDVSNTEQDAVVFFWSETRQDWLPCQFICGYRGGVLIMRHGQFLHFPLNFVMVERSRSLDSDADDDYRITE